MLPVWSLPFSHFYAPMLYSLMYVLYRKERFSYWFVINSRSPFSCQDLISLTLVTPVAGTTGTRSFWPEISSCWHLELQAHKCTQNRVPHSGICSEMKFDKKTGQIRYKAWPNKQTDQPLILPCLFLLKPPCSLLFPPFSSFPTHPVILVQSANTFPSIPKEIKQLQLSIWTSGNAYCVRVTVHWHKFAREVMYSPSLEIFRSYLDMVQGRRTQPLCVSVQADLSGGQSYCLVAFATSSLWENLWGQRNASE